MNEKTVVYVPSAGWTAPAKYINIAVRIIRISCRFPRYSIESGPSHFANFTGRKVKLEELVEPAQLHRLLRLLLGLELARVLLALVLDPLNRPEAANQVNGVFRLTKGHFVSWCQRIARINLAPGNGIIRTEITFPDIAQPPSGLVQTTENENAGITVAKGSV